jgi:hypothetical protein
MTMDKLITLAALVGCIGSEEATTVVLPVATSASAMAPAMTDLGYQVQVTQIRIAVSTIQFTIEGETHSGDTVKGFTALVPPPHPGHSAGGEVTGELPGNFVLAWNGQTGLALGSGTLIVGDYHGANFAFRAADAADQLPDGDRLLGHTFHIAGTASRAGTTKPFDAVLDVERDSELVGAVFEDVITEMSTETLALEFYPTDPYELDTVFDGVDFFTLPETAGSLAIAPGSTAHNILRRAIQTHDHYAVVAQ